MFFSVFLSLGFRVFCFGFRLSLFRDLVFYFSLFDFNLALSLCGGLFRVRLGLLRSFFCEFRFRIFDLRLGLGLTFGLSFGLGFLLGLTFGLGLLRRCFRGLRFSLCGLGLRLVRVHFHFRFGLGLVFRFGFGSRLSLFRDPYIVLGLRFSLAHRFLRSLGFWFTFSFGLRLHGRLRLCFAF